MRRFLPKTLPLLGVAFLVASWFAADAGAGVPILGVLVAVLLAPNLFLAGIVLLSVWAASLFTGDKRLAGALALVLTVLVGLNTRIPAIASGMLHGTADNLQLTRRLEGAVGQPVHIVAGAGLQARKQPYASASPACYGDGCLGTKGFATPNPRIEAFRQARARKTTSQALKPRKSPSASAGLFPNCSSTSKSGAMF